jgi:hypothetical protein
MRFSLLTIILLTTYAAICSTTFVYKNLWLGTLAVVATAVLLGVATLRGFNTPSRFLHTFSIVGWSWLVVWLGFYAETDKNAGNWVCPQAIYSLSQAFRHTALDAGTGGGKLHSLHVTGEMAQHTTAPAYHNFIRLAVCISGLLAGCAAGIVNELVGSIQSN